jgi:hypothetical protein
MIENSKNGSPYPEAAYLVCIWGTTTCPTCRPYSLGGVRLQAGRKLVRRSFRVGIHWWNPVTQERSCSMYGIQLPDV